MLCEGGCRFALPDCHGCPFAPTTWDCCVGLSWVPFCVHDMEPCGARNGSRHPATGAASSSGLAGGFAALPSLDPLAGSATGSPYSSIVPFARPSM